MVSAITPRRYSGAPLLRYDIRDAGGVRSYAAMMRALEAEGFHVPFYVADAPTLPFVWVFGRAFWTVSLYGANVYVENLMVGLEQPTLQQHVTGAAGVSRQHTLLPVAALSWVSLCF